MITEDQEKDTTNDDSIDQEASPHPHRKYREEDYYYDRRPKKHYCWKAFGCLLLLLLVIGGLVYGAFKFVIGPIVTAADKLPDDFPHELVINGIDQAKIRLQTPEEKQRLEKFVNYLPDWLPPPLLKIFTVDPQAQLGGEGDINIESLKSYLNDPDKAGISTVSLSWDAMERKKSELADFYRRQFVDRGFKFQETATGERIDISFWKDGIYGIIKVADGPAGPGSSQADMTVNY